MIPSDRKVWVVVYATGMLALPYAYRYEFEAQKALDGLAESGQKFRTRELEIK